MKGTVILSYVLSVLEGGLSGAFFYRAGQAKDRKCKVLMYLTSALWFALSVLDGMEGSKALKAARQAKAEPENEAEL